MKEPVKEENIDYVIKMMRDCFIRDKAVSITPLEWMTGVLCVFFSYLDLMYKEKRPEDIQEILDFFYNTLDKFCQERPDLVLMIERFEKGAWKDKNVY